MTSVAEVELGQGPVFAHWDAAKRCNFLHFSGTAMTFFPPIHFPVKLSVSLYSWVRDRLRLCFKCQIFFPSWIMIRPVITLGVVPLHNPLCLSRRCIPCQVLRRNWGDFSELLRLNREVVARNLSIKVRQRLVSWLQGEADTPLSLHHLPRGCITQGSHSNPSPCFPRSSCSLSSAQKYLTCYSSAVPLLSVSHSSHRNAMHFRCSDFPGIIFCFLSASYLYSLSCKVQRFWARSDYVHLLLICRVE